MATDLPTRLASRLSLPPHEEDFSTALSSAFAGGSGGFDSGFDSGFDAGSRAEDTIPFGWLIRPDTLPLPISTGAGFVWGDSLFPLPDPAAPSGTIELAGTIAGQATVTADLYNVAGNIRELAGNIDGSTTVTGTLEVTIEMAGAVGGLTTAVGNLDRVFTLDPISGAVTVTANLTNLSAFSGQSAGQTTVTATLAPTHLSTFPIPYQLGYGTAHAVEMGAVVLQSKTTVTGTLTNIHELGGTISGRTFTGKDNSGLPGLHRWELNGSGADSGQRGAIPATIQGAGTQTWPEFHPAQYAPLNRRSMYVPTADYNANINGNPFYQLSTFTWSLWCTADPGALNLIDSSSDSGGGNSFSIKGDDPMTMRCGGSTLVGSIPDDGTWHHVCVTFTSGDRRLYIDGSVADSDTNTGSISWAAPYIEFGGQRSGTFQHLRNWRGHLMDFRFFDVALTPTQVGYLYTVYGVALEAIALPTATVAGSTTVTGSLYVATDAGGGKHSHELAGTIAGVCTVLSAWPWLTIAPPGTDPVTFLLTPDDAYWYFYANIGVGFDDIDDASGLTGFVSQTYPDGNLVDIDYQVFYHLKNIGVGFEPIDDASTHTNFVSQTFPDGNLTDIDYPIWYQELNTIYGGIDADNQLVILPGWTPKIPPSKAPPKGVNQ